MRRNDIFISIICGLAVASVASDFFPAHGLLFFAVFPVLAVFGFLLCDIVGRKFLFVGQAGKFVLAGAFADVIDIKIFQLLIIFAPFSLFFKGISFLIATTIKYWANKHWSFEKHEGGQAVKFFLVTFVGLVINIVSFKYFSIIKTGIPENLWVELSIIFSALVAAVWNFISYKFLVFKK
jgi:putative flippase GtrA